MTLYEYMKLLDPRLGSDNCPPTCLHNRNAITHAQLMSLACTRRNGSTPYQSCKWCSSRTLEEVGVTIRTSKLLNLAKRNGLNA